MIHEEICTYEVSKLAKEKGFDWDCPMLYNLEGKLMYGCAYDPMNSGLDMRDLLCHNSKLPLGFCAECAAPTQSLLQRWMREEKGIIVEVIAQPTCSTSKKNCYWWSVKQNSDGFCYQYEECSYILFSDEGYFATYELALEDALKYALENLV